MKTVQKKILVTLIWLCFAGAAFAQESFYKVYQFETPLQGHLEAVALDTYIGNSSLNYGQFNKDVSRRGLFAHGFEAEVGLTDHLSLGVYGNFEAPNGSALHYSETRVESIYRFGERFDNFINFAVYGEYYFPDNAFSKSQEAEVRVIMDKDIGDFRLVLNPTVSKYTTGDESMKLQPGVSSGVYYRRAFFIQPGVEFYSNFYTHSAALFPAINLNIGPYINWNLGAGFGLNSNSDKFIFKSVLQFDIPVIRPSKLFR